ncbi:MAG: tetratricopeptide repeat protein [Cyanobacteria bacterium P01_E01_bin.42]
MILSIDCKKEIYFFIWQGEGFRDEGEFSPPDTLLSSDTLPSSLQEWQANYDFFCSFHPSRAVIKKAVSAGGFDTESLKISFSELVKQLNFWLKNSDDFLQATFKALQQGDRQLTLIIDPKSKLALLPWEESFLGESYTISYASPRFSPSANGVKGKGIFAVLGDMGEEDRDILDLYDAKIIEKPDLDTLCQALRNCNEEIVYFGSHGDGQNLYFGEIIANERLRRAISASARQGVKILFANSCKGSGLVWLDLPVTAFLIWKLPVPDRVARDFAEFFFEALSNGSYSQAFHEARERLADKHNNIPGLRTMVQLWQKMESPTLNQLSVIEGAGSKRGRGKLGAVVGGLWGNRMKHLKKIVIGGLSLAVSLPLLAHLVSLVAVKIDRGGNVSVASNLYNLTNKLDGNQGIGYYNLASIAEDRGDIEGAITDYKKSADRGTLDAFPSLARLQLLKGNYEQAIKTAGLCIERALQQDIPERWRNNSVILCYARIAWGHWKLGNLSLAESAIQKGLDYDNNRSDNVAFDLYCIALRVYRDTNQKALSRKFSRKIIKSQHGISNLKQIKPACISDANSLIDNDNGSE